MSAGPIPWHHIVDYAEMVGLDQFETEALVEIIGAMDRAWLDWQAEQSKTDTS